MSPIKHQRGSTLIVALIMLVLLTLIAVSAINSTTASIQIVGNAQFREEAGAVAQQAIEKMMSSDFTIAPVSSPISVDINNDGITDYAGQVDVPVCTSSIGLTNGLLNPFNSADAKCLATSQSTNTGIVGASGVISAAQSWCSKQTWDIKSTAADGKTGASTALHQGVFVRVPAGISCL